jgi:thiamine-monophosphate kinase
MDRYPGGDEITIGELGEFGLIARVTARFPQGAASLLGPGVDAAVIAAPDGRVVATTDLLVDGRHFRRDWSSAYDIGRKAAAQNLADVAAMGAVPTALLVGLAAPADIAAFWAERLADGLREECDVAGASVVGGDTVRSDMLTIAITAFGDLQGREPVTRGGAQLGDVVAVAGRLGWAAAGLAALRRGFRTPKAVVDAHRRPEPPYAAGPAAALLAATSMCDVSDGLIADLGHIAESSGVQINVETSALVVPEVLREVGSALGADPLEWVLTGGDDHALVATFPASTRLSGDWRVIGDVVEGSGVRVDGVARSGGGFDHFAQ